MCILTIKWEQRLNISVNFPTSIPQVIQYGGRVSLYSWAEANTCCPPRLITAPRCTQRSKFKAASFVLKSGVKTPTVKRGREAEVVQLRDKLLFAFLELQKTRSQLHVEIVGSLQLVLIVLADVLGMSARQHRSHHSHTCTRPSRPKWIIPLLRSRLV